MTNPYRIAELGTGRLYNRRINQPLQPSTEYAVLFLVRSTVADQTKYAWAVADKTVVTLPVSESANSGVKTNNLFIIIPINARQSLLNTRYDNPHRLSRKFVDCLCRKRGNLVTE